MPKRSARKCNAIACPNLISGNDSYCDIHRKQNHREFKRVRSDKKEQNFYSSKEWISVRNAKRSINPLCEHCLLEGKLTPVDVIDHVRELKDDWSRRLDLSNLQSLCNRCHAIKTAKERQDRLKLM